MSKPIQIDFVFSDGTIHDATLTETSTEINVCFGYNWNITANIDGITGVNPKYTLEAKGKNNQWYVYKIPDAQDVDINDSLCDTHLSFTKLRLIHDGTGTTGGTVTYTIELKNG